MAKKARNEWQRHVRVCHYMMDSQAWKSLGAIPRAVYLDMAKRYNGTNNGGIGYSMRCAVDELNIGLATAKRALDALQERGFIVPVKKGAFSYKHRHATEWLLTEHGYGTALATKDFMKWTPDQNKTRYPERKQSVAVAEAAGSCSGTNRQLSTANGICSGTTTAGLAA